MTTPIEGDRAETEETHPESRVAWKARAERAEAEIARLRKGIQAWLNCTTGEFWDDEYAYFEALLKGQPE